MATINPGFYGAEVPAFLDMLAHAEGTSANPLTLHDGYDVIVDSIHGHLVFTDFDCHPFCVPGEPRPLQVLNHKTPPLESDAAGRYQLMARNWAPYKRDLGLPDFGPLSQDKIAIQQITECRALELVKAGRITQAIGACNRIWASLPGSPYGQGGKSLADLLEFYKERFAACPTH